MKMRIGLALGLVAAVWAWAEANSKVVLTVQRETVEEYVEDEGVITTNVTHRYVFETPAAGGLVQYRSAVSGYATNTPSATVSNDIARDVAAFYRQVNVAIGEIEVRWP